MKSTATIWHRFWRLTGFERRIVVEGFGTLLATRACLKIFDFCRWEHFLMHLVPDANDAKITAAGLNADAAAEVMARLVAATARNAFFQADCLERSLTLWCLLCRHGFAAELRLGARKEMDAFEAHAWVEWNGIALSDPGDGQLPFVPFERPFATGKARTP